MVLYYRGLQGVQDMGRRGMFLHSWGLQIGQKGCGVLLRAVVLCLACSCSRADLVSPSHVLVDVQQRVASSTRLGVGLQLLRISYASRPARRVLGRHDVVHQCVWDPRNEGSCSADDAINVMYAIRAKPSSAYLWFLLMTYDREAVCGKHITAKECNADTQHRCIYIDDILEMVGPVEEHGNASRSSNSSNSSSKKNGSGTGSQNSSTSSSSGSSIKQSNSSSQPLSQPSRDQAAATTPAMGNAIAAASVKKNSTRVANVTQPIGAAQAVARHPPGRNVVCTNRDLLENYVFTRSTYSNPLQAPLTLHCPGSRAYTLLTCMRPKRKAACIAIPGCEFVIGSEVIAAGAGADAAGLCISTYLRSLNREQVMDFTFNITLADPSVVGSCDGACWMRQALLCNRTTATDECRALSFCRYSASSGTCGPRLYADDDFGSSVQEYVGECEEVDNKKDCDSLKLTLINKGSYADWTMPHKPSSECSVASIDNIIKSGGKPPKSTILTIGAPEEKAAELQAAHVATAAAANAARLVSDRGPIALIRQVYFLGGRD